MCHENRRCLSVREAGEWFLFCLSCSVLLFVKGVQEINVSWCVYGLIYDFNSVFLNQFDVVFMGRFYYTWQDYSWVHKFKKKKILLWELCVHPCGYFWLMGKQTHTNIHLPPSQVVDSHPVRLQQGCQCVPPVRGNKGFYRTLQINLIQSSSICFFFFVFCTWSVVKRTRIRGLVFCLQDSIKAHLLSVFYREFLIFLKRFYHLQTPFSRLWCL